MILEEETKVEFGYYSTEWGINSNKKILVKCDECGEIRTIEKGGYSDLCRSCSRKGKKHWNWQGGGIKRECTFCGKTFFVKPSDLKRAKCLFCSYQCRANNQKEQRIKRTCKECGKEIFLKPSVIKDGKGIFCSKSCAFKNRKMITPRHHTKPEMIFEAMTKKYNLPFKYTGDGTFWIHNINPDFVESNGKKLVVEIFGDYWHSPLLNHKLKEDRTLPYRKRALKKYGWKLIVFWESDLKRKDAEAFVLNRLKTNIKQ